MLILLIVFLVDYCCIFCLLLFVELNCFFKSGNQSITALEYVFHSLDISPNKGKTSIAIRDKVQ